MGSSVGQVLEHQYPVDVSGFDRQVVHIINYYWVFFQKNKSQNNVTCALFLLIYNLNKINIIHLIIEKQ
jgi:hypothetical protein